MTVITEIDLLSLGSLGAVPGAQEGRPVAAPPMRRGLLPAQGVPALPVHLRQLHKSYGKREVLSGLDLDIAAGEFVAIVGRSGCGKSTLLRVLAGLEEADAGGVDVGTAEVRVMFQDARLLPWARVLDNVALGLRGADRLDRAREALAEVGLADRARDWPAQLSGGQRQRVALARALVHTPRLLLLDEPLGAQDALTRIEMQRLIERLWLQHRFTAVLVTHDVTEAVALADRVLLLDEGRVALDQRVPLCRPRPRDAVFAGLEQALLDRLLRPAAMAAASGVDAAVAG